MKTTPEQKHTPGHHLGPWLWNGNEIYTASGIPVLIVDYPSRFSISDEDKALLAAAPELLAMLREALPAVEYLADNGSDHSGQWGKTAALIEQAIARATGGQL